ncbi:SdpI family protein [Eubacterium sp. 1001713B170207_170306_E7]|uniref:SdpI family protein n=1 Tax=Eubacterium sp. 1001713B170207_170306_E7 TaxID=2787097 RepID=UPI001899AFFC|nr:SdpI family protein [Eubacterium sp. 1001713B170207_170306_E7]
MNLTPFTFLIPVLCTVFGGLFLWHPPKDIKGLYGYRTSRAMKNEDTWKFAHTVAGKIWLIMGLVMLMVLGLALLLFREQYAEVSLYIQISQDVLLILSFFSVEKALENTFDADGNRK